MPELRQQLRRWNDAAYNWRMAGRNRALNWDDESYASGRCYSQPIPLIFKMLPMIKPSWDEMPKRHARDELKRHRLSFSPFTCIRIKENAQLEWHVCQKCHQSLWSQRTNSAKHSTNQWAEVCLCFSQIVKILGRVWTSLKWTTVLDIAGVSRELREKIEDLYHTCWMGENQSAYRSIEY